MTFTDLHVPMIPFLRRTLAAAPLSRSGIILDLACGDAQKWPLYREILGADVTLVGVDLGFSVRPQAAGKIVALIQKGMTTPIEAEQLLLTADAHRLPFAAAMLDGALCVAAFGLFSEPERVLRDVRYALKPGAVAVYVTAERRWVYAWRWSPRLALRVAAACADVVIPLSHPDLTGDLVAQLQATGYSSIGSMAALLDSDLPEVCAALAVLPWNVLLPILTPRISLSDLAACEYTECDLELRSIALAAWGMQNKPSVENGS